MLRDERVTKPEGKGTPALRVAAIFSCGFVARRSQTYGYAPPSRLATTKNRLATRPCPILKTRPRAQQAERRFD